MAEGEGVRLDRHRALGVARLALFFFAFLQSELMFDDAMAALVDERGVVLAQAAVLAASAVGFAAYPAARSASRRLEARAGRLAAMAPAMIGAALTAVVVAVPHAADTSIALGCAAFAAYGLFCGQAHLCALAEATRTVSGHEGDGEKHPTGLAGLAGSAYALALLLQFAVNAVPEGAVAGAVAVGAAAVAGGGLVARTARRPGEPLAGVTGEPSVEKTAKPSLAITALLLVGLMTCIFSTLDNIVTLAHASGAINVVASPRLILAASGAVAGLAFDRIGCRGSALLSFCSAMAATIVLLIAQSGGSMDAALVIFYVSAGVFAVYFTSEFLHVAGASEHLERWAGMGRAENNLVAALFAVPSLALMGTGDAVVIMAVALGLLCLTAVAAALHIKTLSDCGTQGTAAAQAEDLPSLEERVELAANKYQLTPREKDVLLAVASTEDTLASVADGLGISLRMVQRHLTSIYKKTGASSRAGLVALLAR